MGINEETVKLNFKWTKLSGKTKIFLTGSVIFAFSLIRLSFSTEYIGGFSGECIGECTANYTITTNEIVIDKYNNDTNKKTHEVLTGDFSNLKFNAPLLLLSNITGTFGCPDCDDGGGYIMGFKFFWIPFKFTFDRNSSPWYFSNAIDIISDRLKKIDPLEAARSKP